MRWVGDFPLLVLSSAKSHRAPPKIMLLQYSPSLSSNRWPSLASHSMGSLRSRIACPSVIPTTHPRSHGSWASFLESVPMILRMPLGTTVFLEHWGNLRGTQSTILPTKLRSCTMLLNSLTDVFQAPETFVSSFANPVLLSHEVGDNEASAR